MPEIFFSPLLVLLKFMSERLKTERCIRSLLNVAKSELIFLLRIIKYIADGGCR